MSSVVTDNNILNSFFQYISVLDNKFTTYVNELKNIYKLSNDDISEILEELNKISKSSDIKATKNINTSNSKAVEKPEISKCSFILKSGVRQGNECGNKVCLQSKTKKYCGKHLKAEETDYDNSDKKSSEEQIKPIFRINKFGNFVYGETGLMLNNKTEKIVIGKQLVDGNILELSQLDMEICERNQFKYISKNKHGNYVFGKTDYILNNQTDKIIIGKQLEDGNFADLNQDDITFCKSIKFKFMREYSKKLLNV